MIKRILAAISMTVAFSCAISATGQAGSEPGKIDSHLADDHADLEAWATQGSKQVVTAQAWHHPA